MKLFKTLRTARPLFSTDNVVELKAPQSWKELTQVQLHYVLGLLASFNESVIVRTYMFCRFTGIHVLKKDRFGWRCFVRTTWWGKRRFFTLQEWQVQSFTEQFKYIDSYEDMGVRLEDIHGLHAVDVCLHGCSFYEYLQMEKYYQAYMINRDDRFLKQLAVWMYMDKKGKHPAAPFRLDKAELLGTYLWYAYVKSEFGRLFPHFFKKQSAEFSSDFSFLEGMNAQIRALTDGDVTKEKQIYDTDCWRALTELDQKAREAEEFKMKYGK